MASQHTAEFRQEAVRVALTVVLSHKLPRFARGVVYRQLVLMDTLTISYKRHRFPPEIIAHAVWLYCRFNLSLREVEEMFLQRGI
ncbi:MAG: hypothetical protein AAED33_10630, partial [Paracoccaceae bacterium]